jgi:uncharacterized integral membrane protein
MQSNQAGENGAQAPFSFGAFFLKPGRKGRMAGTSDTQPSMKNITRYLGLALKLLVFLLVLGFALKNSHSIQFNGYLGQVWQAPLIVMLGLAFVLGALTGVLALLPSIFRLRREATRKGRENDLDTAITQPDIPVV